MKSILPLASIALVLASCSTAYQSGQTPDDVYFSPERPVEEYVHVAKQSDKQYRSDRGYYEDRDDRLVRMKLRNRLLSSLDDDWYYYDSYTRYRGNYMNYYSPFNYSYYWNYHYNPYYTPYHGYYNYYNPYGRSYVTPVNVYNKPRTYNLFVFDKEMNNVNPNLPKGNRGSNVGYRDNTDNYRGSGQNAGDFLRNVFGNSSSGNTKMSTPPSSNSGSSSSGSSSSGSNSESNSSRGRATRGNQ